uniref:Uncharacterized protein n=1 Tax=Craspedostauros australis TaxID=1486917 RepID=A0A7R9ZNL2_9STRA|mmetsp:Transcript_21547/g.59963  ORF Transcript_21547/g.59963 Transcript_21547/m.59963 type:complete len:181 (+) Transcript_21547:408-950(+)|eukprot:CAMPEP_0198133656 /NCGR_PEP_ID=MMETSP1442-20131203/59676_1 /TAXON_ID= /ORGANISM="Craspedostauros australis, Strain CCMP3328" /LENGTH=180 /DNA_ID=CAMNT_0043794787 /DNA_START=408 /DNA_END=950 /DNA_ORIENTATION=+
MPTAPKSIVCLAWLSTAAVPCAAFAPGLTLPRQAAHRREVAMDMVSFNQMFDWNNNHNHHDAYNANPADDGNSASQDSLWFAKDTSQQAQHYEDEVEQYLQAREQRAMDGPAPPPVVALNKEAGSISSQEMMDSVAEGENQLNPEGIYTASKNLSEQAASQELDVDTFLALINHVGDVYM